MPSTVQKGSSGSDVTLCQQRLNVWGCPCTVDGLFGSGTEAAAIAFQTQEGLTPDGVVGPKTWDALLLEPAETGAPVYSKLDELSRAMLTEIAWYVGWQYSASGQPTLVAQPSRLVPSSYVWAPGKKTTTVCCVFVAGVVGRVYDATARWTANAWQNFMVPAAEPWAMADEAIAAGIGTAYTGTLSPGAWYLVQGWSGLVNGQAVASSSGHQWIQYGPDLMVEATNYTDEDADGSSTDPGAVAWRHRTWAQQAARYQEVRLVALRTP